MKRNITVNETWVYHFDSESKMHSSQWKHTYSPSYKKSRVIRTSKKHMSVVFFDIDGVVLCHAVPEGQSINAAYYSKVIKG